ncbi:hypothetical protein [Flagellimonas aurea]|uniref:hypothetical protein n=1 Tax=Flagellimonas aurea TaxID=2915619 RepID=UPI0035CEFAD0
MALFDSEDSSNFLGYYSEERFWEIDKVRTDKKGTQATILSLGNRFSDVVTFKPIDDSSRVFISHKRLYRDGNVFEIYVKYGHKLYGDEEPLTFQLLESRGDIQETEGQVLGLQLTNYANFIIDKQYALPDGTLAPLSNSELQVLFDILFVFKQIQDDTALVNFFNQKGVFDVFDTHWSLPLRYSAPSTSLDPDYHLTYNAEYFALFRLKLIEFWYWLLNYEGNYSTIGENDLQVYLVNLFPIEELRELTYDMKTSLLTRIILDNNSWLIGDWYFNELNEEEAIVKLVRSIAKEDTGGNLNFQEINDFLDFLNSPIDLAANRTLYEVLYAKIQDDLLFGDDGKGNKGQYVKAVYNLWLESKYNPFREDAVLDADTVLANALNRFSYTPNNATWKFEDPSQTNEVDYDAAPLLLNYESEKVGVWYKDNFNFGFENRKVRADREEITGAVISNNGVVHQTKSYRPYGFYEIYQTIAIKASDADDTIVRMPLLGVDEINQPSDYEYLNNAIPAFYLQYVDDLGDYSDAKQTIGTVADVVLTFTGIGNLTKLRHLKYLSLIRRLGTLNTVEKLRLASALGKVASLAETVTGALSVVLNFTTDNCTVYYDNPGSEPDPQDPDYQDYIFCQKANLWLFALEVASLSGDLLARRAFKRATKELKDNIPNSSTNDYSEVSDALDLFDEWSSDFANFLSELPTSYPNIDSRMTALNFTNDQKLLFFLDVQSKPRLTRFFDDNSDLVDTWYALVDQPLLRKKMDFLDQIKNYDSTLLQTLDGDLNHPVYGKEILALFDESSEDVNNIWKVLKDDPAYGWGQRDIVDGRWRLWIQREFFKFITVIGKKFEKETVLPLLKNRSSTGYLNLKGKVNTDFGKNLDDYDLYSQVQLKYDGDNYFVADQLFVKYGVDSDGYNTVEDIVIIESKLKEGTVLSKAQLKARGNNELIVRSKKTKSLFSNQENLSAKETLKFDGDIKWYKAYDFDDGESLNDIKKINLDGSI